MTSVQLVYLLFALFTLAGIGAVAYILVGNARQPTMKTGGLRDLMGSQLGASERQTKRSESGLDPLDLDVETLRRERSQHSRKAKSEDISSKLFRAGRFSPQDRARFARFRVTAFVVSTIGLPAVMLPLQMPPIIILLGLMMGMLIGYALPMSGLERAIRRREDDIMYFLPLVIEQVSIGVSSALDIGPCVSQIVSMANERDSHNPVTEMFVHVEKLIRSGLNLEDALVEVSDASGMQEVKHAFMFLAQCSKHGGELSKQLQELADSIMVQRQVQVEAKITSLPVKATGPLATVFAGFFALLFAGLIVRFLTAFGSN